MGQDKNYMLPLYIDGLKHFSSQELKNIKNSIENRLNKDFFESFKLQEGKCYINTHKDVTIKVKKIHTPYPDSIKVIAEYYSTTLPNTLCFENDAIMWFYKDSVAQFSQREFHEISEEKYNKIIEELKSFEKQRKKLNEEHEKILNSILKE